jgi:rhodanese-related sulfurtransferase
MRIGWCLLSMVFTIISCSQHRVQSDAYDAMLSILLSHSVNEVTVNETESLNSPIFLDARTLNEFNVSHIENARFVGFDSMQLSALEGIEKDQPLVVYCSVGYRSEKVAERLIELGYTNVKNLYGGLFEWMNQNRTVVDVNNLKTKRIHAYDKTWGVWLTQGEKVYH